MTGPVLRVHPNLETALVARNFTPIPSIARALFYYDGEHLRNRVDRYRGVGNLVARAGDVAGTISKRDGRRSVGIEGKKYLVRRVIWFIVTGADPGNFQLDHRDLNRLNNCFSNLRPATGSGDNANKRRFRTTASLPKRCRRISGTVLT